MSVSSKKARPTVSISSRIDPTLARELVSSAEKSGITLSKKIEIILASWNEEISSAVRYRKAAAEIISEFVPQDYRMDAINLFNQKLNLNNE